MDHWCSFGEYCVTQKQVYVFFNRRQYMASRIFLCWVHWGVGSHATRTSVRDTALFRSRKLKLGVVIYRWFSFSAISVGWRLGNRFQHVLQRIFKLLRILKEVLDGKSALFFRFGSSFRSRASISVLRLWRAGGFGLLFSTIVDSASRYWSQARALYLKNLWVKKFDGRWIVMPHQNWNSDLVSAIYIGRNA